LGGLVSFYGMAKLRTDRFRFGTDETIKLDFKVDIHVNQSGEFTATLPHEVSLVLENAGISLMRNQLGNNGYFKESTYDKLIHSISEKCKEYVSEEIISTSIVILYQIQTACTYMSKNNEYCAPNGVGTGYNNSHEFKWKYGNFSIDATNPHHFGINIYAASKRKIVYRYKSGKERSHFISMWGDEIEGCPELTRLCQFTCIAPIDRNGGCIQEIDYTEDIAMFFSNMLISICKLNDKIKDFTDPDSIKMLVENKQKLLG